MVTFSYEQLLSKLKSLNCTPDEAQLHLKQMHASIVMAIRVTRAAYGISMGDAKKIVDRHPVWVDQSALGHEIQEKAIAAAAELLAQ
jgi:ribosomal protein L7/L12